MLYYSFEGSRFRLFKLHLSKFYTFYITLILIATSGTVLFSRVYYQQGLVLLLFSSLLLFRPKIHIKQLLWFFIFVIAIFINYLFTSNSDITGYISLLIKIISVFLIFTAINIKWFIRYYIYIIATICFISIFFYGFGLVNPNFIRTYVEITTVWGHDLRITPFYIYSVWFTNRNNGVYWEPGAFQTFINIAVLLLNQVKLDIKRKKTLNVLFFITIVSTFSTTGYIVYGIIMFLNINKGIFKLTKRNLPKIFLTFLFLASFIFIEETKIGAISNKFDESSNTFMSYERRTYDLQVGLDLISRQPFFGWGIGNDQMYEGYNYNGSSNGLLIFMSQLGILFSVFYMLVFLFTIKRFTGGLFKTSAVFIALILLTMAEDILLFPLFLIPMFITDSLKNEFQIKQDPN